MKHLSTKNSWLLMSKKIPKQEEEINENFKILPLEKLRIKTYLQEPPIDLEMKPLPKHLEYAFLEKDSLLPVVISTLLKDDEKKRLVSVLKNHKEAFSWKTSDIPVFRDQVRILAKDKGFGHEMHKSEESEVVYGVTSLKNYAVTYSNEEMSHHTLYGIKPLLLYAATFKFTRDDLSDSALRRNICDRVTP
ncbi:hypothetical protein Tco_1266439 [Tanacetum coccineum]